MLDVDHSELSCEDCVSEVQKYSIECTHYTTLARARYRVKNRPTNHEHPHVPTPGFLKVQLKKLVKLQLLCRKLLSSLNNVRCLFLNFVYGSYK